MSSSYIHIPFCKDICSYCDFTRCRYHEGLANRYIEAIIKEIHEKLDGVELTTLYIGGGTPTALSTTQLEQVLQALAPATHEVKEYTIEANVESLSDDKLSLMKNYGVNRISLGIQTLQDNLLKRIHRHHNRAMVVDAIKRIHRSGIHAISVDLIYALPQQTMRQWQEDLAFLCACDIQHISLYALTIEEHSAFGREGVKGMEEGLEAEMFEYAIHYLSSQGFDHYEISNFARGNARSLHNQVYWHYQDFIGIGCGASGKEQHMRYDNTCNLQTYFEQGSTPQNIVLSKEDEMFEYVMMGLRMKEGISLVAFEECYGVSLLTHYESAIARQREKGLLVIEDGYVHTTYRGMLLLNDVLVDFL